MHKHNWPQKLLAEFAGTFAVVLISIGVDVLFRPTDTFPIVHNPLAIAIACGATYGAAIATLGHISGGHFNPAITVAHWVTHRLGTFATLLYVVAQLAGATAAAYALRWAWALPVGAVGASRAALVAPPVLASGLARGPALLIEAAGAFALVLALWATLVDRARPRYWLGGIVAGTVVAAASFAAMPYTGGVINPARAFGPALAARLWGYQEVYWVGPLAGAVAAASLYDFLFRRASGRALPATVRAAVPRNSSR